MKIKVLRIISWSNASEPCSLATNIFAILDRLTKSCCNLYTITGFPWHANGPRLARPSETRSMEIQKLVRLEGGTGPQKNLGLLARATEPATWNQQVRSF